MQLTKCRDFKISYLAALKKRLPAGVSSQAPGLTVKQTADYEKHRYKCQDRIYFLDKAGKGKNYWVRINNDEIEIPYNELLFLVFLSRESRKKKGGWVSGKTLEAENITRDISHTQRTIRDIRTKSKPYLLKNNEKEFIENDRRGNYRISIHPDFIAVPSKKWVSTQYNRIKKEVLKEREKRRQKWDKGI